jgi:penicillin-binding protein A
MPLPYLVEAVVEPDGKTMNGCPTGAIQEIDEAATAQQVRQMMVRAVNDGSGSAARIAGAQWGGKTGTHSWVEACRRMPGSPALPRTGHTRW